MTGQPHGETGFPSNPDEVHGWIESLPLTDMGETTRRFFHGVRTLEEMDLAPTTRLQILEALQPTARLVLDHIDRQLKHRTLPLPKKSHLLVELNETLLSRLASCYRGVIHDAIKRNAKLEEDGLARALYRVTRHLGELAQDLARLYIPCPEGVWLALHETYLFAETHRLLDVPITDMTRGQDTKSSVAAAYKECCLLALTNPPALRQGEVDRLAAFFRTRTDLCAVTPHVVAENDETAIVVNLGTDGPPYHVVAREVSGNGNIRGLTVDALDQDLRDIGQQPDDGASSGAITPDLARRALKAITTIPRRQFARTPKGSEIYAAIGVERIHMAIAKDRYATGIELSISSLNDTHASIGSAAPVLQKPFLELSLQKIEKRLEGNEHDSAPLSAPLKMEKSGEVWDMVAYGRIALNPPSRETESLVHAEQGDVTWNLINLSAGGHCLSWDRPESSQALVGELISLREIDGGHSHWKIGAIRWMRFNPGKDLSIGIQAFASNAKPAEIRPGTAPVRHKKDAHHVKGLLLPAVESARLPATLIAPSDAFHIGDEVTCTIDEQDHAIRLEQIEEQTSLFVQFRFTPLDTGNGGGGEDKFATLWGML